VRNYKLNPKMKKAISLYLPLLMSIFFLFQNRLYAQGGPPSTKEEYEREYQSRIQKEYLYGVYIPKDMADAFRELDKRIDKESREKFLSLSEDEAWHKLFFSLGRWITYNWGFYGGSRFSHYLKGMGLSHPDDMARFVIVMYHRHLSEKPLDPKPVIEQILEERKAQLPKREVISREVRKRGEGANAP